MDKELSDALDRRFADDQSARRHAGQWAEQVAQDRVTPEQVAQRWHVARRKERAAMVELIGAIIAAHTTLGMTTVEIARRCRVNRLTVRRALNPGKHRD